MRISCIPATVAAHGLWLRQCNRFTGFPWSSTITRVVLVVRGNRERGSREHQRPARRAAAPLDDCVVARLRSAGQLFRPGKPVGLSRCASFRLQHHHRSVWLPAERLQLDLCPNATSFRRIAGPLWSSPNWPNQYVAVERGLFWSSHRHWPEEFSCRAIAAWSGRGPDVSRKLEGCWLLVSCARAEPGNRVLRFCRQTWPGDWAAATWPSAAAVRVAMEFHDDGVPQLDLFRAVLLDLSQPHLRHISDRDRTRVYPSRRSAAGRTRQSGKGSPASLFVAPAKGDRAGVGVLRLQLYFLFVADLGAQLSLQGAACGPLAFRLLCKRAVACRNSQRIFPGRLAGQFPDSQRLERIARPASRTDCGNEFWLGHIWSCWSAHSGQRGILDEYFPGRPFGGIASVLVHSFFDRARRRCGEVGGNSKFWRPVVGDHCACCNWLYRDGDGLVCIGLRCSRGVSAARHRRLSVLARANRANSRAGLRSR